METALHSSSTKKWQLNETEIGYNLEDRPNAFGKTEQALWKIHIPRLRPLIPIGLPKETRESLPQTLFANERSCRPVVQSSITLRNYLEVIRPDNCSFVYKWKPHLMLVEVDVLRCNMDKLRINHMTDNSVPTNGSGKKK